MNSMEKLKAWLNEKDASPGRKFFQIAILIIGGVFAMGIGALLVGVILIASPLLTVLILIFLAGYGIASLVKS